MENNIGEARRRYASYVGKFTQEDAAEFFGVSLSTYKKWEQGQGKLNGANLRAISDKYGVTTDYLLMKSDDIDALQAEPQPLDADEERIIKYYRNMSEDDKEHFLHYAKAISNNV